MSTLSSKPCPICRRPRDHALKQRSSSAHENALKQRSGSAPENPFHPFCSQRCKDRDLARWFSDSYTVAGPPADPEALAANDWREQD